MLRRAISRIVAVVATLAAATLATCLAATVLRHCPTPAPAVVVLLDATAQPTYQQVDLTVRTRSTQR